MNQLHYKINNVAIHDTKIFNVNLNNKFMTINFDINQSNYLIRIFFL